MSVLDGLDPRLVEWGERLLGQARTNLTITSVRRSRARQARLYRAYLRGENPFPVAPPGKSAHEHGLAWDMVGPLSELRRLGRLWRRWGGSWGGARDPIHFGAGRLLR